MKKFKQCAASRYCRMNTFIKLSALSVVGAVVAIVMLSGLHPL